jgi:O-acetyl-ADP-ribose deacetylase (regulator of RNase III)
MSAFVSKIGGTTIAEELNELTEKHGKLEPGSCRTSKAGLLKCKHLIHCKGPNYLELKSEYDAKQLLTKTINNIIFEAEQNLKVQSIAIPAISCGGTFKFPKKLCV